MAAGEYAELLKEYGGCDIEDIGSVRAKAGQLKIEHKNMDDAVVINEVFEKTVEEQLINPTFVMDYPAALCPLTKTEERQARYSRAVRAVYRGDGIGQRLYGAE